MARRGTRALGLLLTSLVLVIGLAQFPAAVAEETGPDRWTHSQGELVPALAQPATPTGPASASATYSGYFADQHEENLPADLYVYRNSDGQLVRKVQVAESASVLEPRVEGNSILQLSESAHWIGIDTLTVRDVETFGVVHTFSFAHGAHILGFGESWILTCSVGETTGICPVRLQTSSGIDRQLDINVSNNTEISQTFSTATTPAVRDTSDNWWSIGIDDGEKSATTFPELGGATTDRYFSVESIYYPESATRLRWEDKDGGGEGQIEIPGYHDSNAFLPFGNRVALLTVPEGGSTRSKDLSPVDLETGAIEAPIARKVGGYKVVPDGRIVLGLGDTPTGRLAFVGDDGLPPKTIATLDEAGPSVKSLMLSGGDLAATWGMTANREETLYFSRLDGSKPWTTTLSPGFEAPLIDPSRNGFVDYSGGVVLTDPAGNTPMNAHTFRLDWAGGHRELTSAYGSVLLGKGGALVGRTVKNASGGSVDHIEVLDTKVEEQTPLATMPDGTPYALDKKWLWSLSGSTLTGTNTATMQTKTVPAGPGCGRKLDVVDHWALISCYPDARVVDLTGADAPWAVPLVARDQGPMIGGGFVAWVHYRTDTRGEYPTLEVASLKNSHERRTYGPVRGMTFPPGPTIEPDDSGAMTLAYADSHDQVRRLDLGWVNADVTKPSTPKVGALGRIAGTPKPTVTVSYDATDDRGVASYEVQRVSMRPHTPANVWTVMQAWSAAKSVSRVIATGDDVCFRVRARDAAANVSAWSTAPCVAAPYDDRNLSSKGRISRKSNSKAMSRTETQLLKKGAYLYRRSQKGSDIAVIAYRGPHEGNLYVYLGSKKVGTIHLKNSRTARVTLTIKSSKTYSGTLKLVSASSKRARIDGVAVLH